MAQEIISAQGDLDGALKQGAGHLLRYLSQLKEEYLILGLCGGRSVVGLLGALKELAKGDTAAILTRIHFFMVDERLVPLTDEASNFGMLKKLLFDDLVKSGVIQEEQLHPFVPQPAATDHGTGAYWQELQRFGGRFSAVVLGVGEDGHVAGLFPGHPSLQRPERGFLSFYDSPKPPPERMTATVPLVTSAGLSLLLFFGEAKRAAWEAFRRPSSEITECPAVVTRAVETTYVLTDLA